MRIAGAVGSFYPLIVATTFGLIPACVLGQEAVSTPPEAASRCSAPEHRQFDFWLGEWAVHNAAGELIGHNGITRVARGCGLLENWRGVSGGQGVSINSYDAVRKKWTQRWVGDGADLWLEGEFRDGQMVLTGTAPRATPDGDVLDRIAWTPLQEGRVLQQWDVSGDAGKSWSRLFEGFYERSTDPPSGSAPASGGSTDGLQPAD